VEAAARREASVIKHAYLQKHASPIAAGGEFHWYPAIDAGPELVERLRGVSPPAVLWELAPGRVVWAQTFAATAPTDGRRYVGLVASIVEGDGAAGELLGELVAPPARPWGEAGDDAVETDDIGDPVAIARALLAGGDAAAGDLGARLPARIASFEALVPDGIAARVRCGVWHATGGAPKQDRVAELMVSAWLGNPNAMRGWRLLGELATARGDSLDVVAADLDDGGLDRALSTDERDMLGSKREFVSVLNAWGRGQLDGSPGAATLAVRLADVLALRALADLVSGRDATLAIAEARWHALLPATRRSELLATAIERAPSLLEVIHA
jgi:hypothetical protein